MNSVVVRWHGNTDYQTVVDSMLAFTDQRTINTPDEIWILQHDSVFTQGTSCHAVPRQNPDNYPVVHSSRGGQMTYHGPGQLIVYLLLDIKRLVLGPKKLVCKVEQSIINLLSNYAITAERKERAPGVYVHGAKIAALGLRIRKGKCFHGLSLNVDMDLTPFEWIDPCGYADLAVTQLKDQGVSDSVSLVATKLKQHLIAEFMWGNIKECDLQPGA